MGGDEHEKSPGGSAILRHDAREEPWSPPAQGIEGAAEKIEEAIQGHFGTVEIVFHEIISDLVHLDVHRIPPSERHPYHVLFTTGMSDLPMTLPDGVDVEPRAELMLALPPEWKFSDEDLKDERWYWPIRWLKKLARLPHEYSTWLGIGHTVPNGDPPSRFAEGVPYCCALVAPPLLLPPAAHVVDIPGGEAVRILALTWLHPGEVLLKLNSGTDALLDRLDKVGATELLDLARPDVSKRKKLFGIF